MRRGADQQSASGATVVEYALLAAAVGFAFLAGMNVLQGGLKMIFAGQADRLAAGSAEVGGSETGVDGPQAGGSDLPSPPHEPPPPDVPHGSEPDRDAPAESDESGDETGPEDGDFGADDESETGDGSGAPEDPELDEQTPPRFTSDDLAFDSAGATPTSSGWDARLTVLVEAPPGTVLHYEWEYTSNHTIIGGSGTGTCIVAGKQCLILQKGLRIPPGRHTGDVVFRITRVADHDLLPPKTAEPITAP